MAALIFSKDGLKADEAGPTGNEFVPMAAVMTNFRDVVVSHTAGPPTINPDARPSALANYRTDRHVILRVEADETNAKFPRAGYYQLVGVSVTEGQRVAALCRATDATPPA